MSPAELARSLDPPAAEPFADSKNEQIASMLLPDTMPTAQPVEHGGWDPVEVWRTRVLLPRLLAALEQRALQELASGVARR